MMTEWKELEGKTIKKVTEDNFAGCLLTFEDGQYAYIVGGGEEIHGSHWPILSDDVGFAKDILAEEEDPCAGCGNQGSGGLFGHLPPGDGLNLCRDVCLKEG